MEEGIPPVLLQLVEPDAQPVLGRPQVRLVVAVGLDRSLAQPADRGGHARRRQILHPAVVEVVQAGHLACLRDLQVARRSHPRVHGTER